jgi:hypothetical protein
MASGANRLPPSHRTPDLSATPSLRGSQPGTPWREDDENAPLLRSHDIERAAYLSARKCYNL